MQSREPNGPNGAPFKRPVLDLPVDAHRLPAAAPSPSDDVEITAPAPASSRHRKLKLKERVRAMGEAVRVPDKRGIFIPLTFAGILLTTLVTMGGVFYRAGQIVQNQNTQEAARIEMNRQWSEALSDLKGELEGVREVRAAMTNVSNRVQTIEDSMSQFTRQAIEDQADLKAQQDSLRRDLESQKNKHELLEDYTEGRISGLPYRPPSG